VGNARTVGQADVLNFLAFSRGGTFEGDGRERRALSSVGILRDITECKERDEKVRRLMREINHRARTCSTSLNRLPHRTAAKNPAEFVERHSRRIQARSADQDLLVPNE
jgi:hypothetical protein